MLEYSDVPGATPNAVWSVPVNWFAYTGDDLRCSGVRSQPMASVLKSNGTAKQGHTGNGPGRELSERTVASRIGYLQTPYGGDEAYGRVLRPERVSGVRDPRRAPELIWALCVLNTFTPGSLCVFKAQGIPKSRPFRRSPFRVRTNFIKGTDYCNDGV